MLYLQSRAAELVTDNDLGPDWLLVTRAGNEGARSFHNHGEGNAQLEPNFTSTYHGLMLVLHSVSKVEVWKR